MDMFTAEEMLENWRNGNRKGVIAEAKRDGALVEFAGFCRLLNEDEAETLIRMLRNDRD